MLAHHMSICPGLGGRGQRIEESRKSLITKEMEQETEGGQREMNRPTRMEGNTHREKERRREETWQESNSRHQH